MRDGARSAQHQDSGAENSSALKGRDQQPVGLGSRRRPKPGANGHGAGRRRGSVPPQRLPGSEVRRGEGALRLFQAGSAGVVTRLQLVLLAPDRHQGARERSHARLWRQHAGSLPPPRFWPPFSSRPTHAFPQPHPAEWGASFHRGWLGVFQSSSQWPLRRASWRAHRCFIPSSVQNCPARLKRHCRCRQADSTAPLPIGPWRESSR